MKYRRQALRRLDAPEQLDEAVRLAGVPTWLTAVALTLAVGFAAAWSTTTEVRRVVEAAGVLIHSAGVSPLDAVEGGQVMEVWGALNHRVAKGTPLYSLRTADQRIVIVNAPWDAYVVSWMISEGQLLQPGTRIADMERLDSPDDNLQAVVYVAASSAPLLRPGNQVEVVAEAVPSTIFGKLRGTVATVGAFPETEESLRAFLGSGADVRRLLAGGSVIRVAVPLEPDPDSPTGLRWSKQSPPFQLNSVSAVTASFTVAVEHPIDWLLKR